MTDREIISFLETEIGPDWMAHFHPPFVEALTPQTEGYRVVDSLLREGWSPREVSHHPIYGLFANIASDHPSLARLGRILNGVPAFGD